MTQLRTSLLASLTLLSLAGIAGCSGDHMAPGNDAGLPPGDGGTPIDAFGPDGFTPEDAWIPPDAPWVGDAGPVSCSAQDAQAMLCPSAICDGFDSWAWDGSRCVRIDCGTCVGADCAGLPHTEAECSARHAGCEASLCRATGGDWLFWPAGCGPTQCGQPSPALCLVPVPLCDCGNGRSFGAAGCFDDPRCPVVDPLPPETLCTTTGGTWSRGICCPTRCGQACGADCAADACTCGALQIFDPVRGCIDAAECHVIANGGVCNASTRCQDGLICCQHCGGAGCAPDMTCQAPVCSSDPNIDVCGNNRLAP
jgi:hypothetical protein